MRWKLAIDKYIKIRATRSATLVAFSGEVNDKECGPDAFTETGQDAEPEHQWPRHPRRLQGVTISNPPCRKQVPDRVRSTASLRYVRGSSRLAGIQAVQTLSRLNRAHPGKDTTYVLDFVNSSDEVLAAFKTYYETAELEGVTDPNLVFDLRAKLDAVRSL